MVAGRRQGSVTTGDQVHSLHALVVGTQCVQARFAVAVALGALSSFLKHSLTPGYRNRRTPSRAATPRLGLRRCWRRARAAGPAKAKGVRVTSRTSREPLQQSSRQRRNAEYTVVFSSLVPTFSSSAAVGRSLGSRRRHWVTKSRAMGSSLQCDCGQFGSQVRRQRLLTICTW